MSRKSRDVAMSRSGLFKIQLLESNPVENENHQVIQETNASFDLNFPQNDFAFQARNRFPSSNQFNSQFSKDKNATTVNSPTDSRDRVEITSINSATAEEISYLPLKLAVDLVPRFDGKPSELPKFLTQCKVANSSVKPADQRHLLAMIRSKIGGQADQLLRNRRQPESLNDLMSLLRSSFSRHFDLNGIHDELSKLKQTEGENVEFFGSRVLEVLCRGQEAVNENYSSHLIAGAQAHLNSAAISCFLRGLRNSSTIALLSKDTPNSLEDAINIAVKVEKDTANCSQQNSNNNPKVNEAKTFISFGHQQERRSRRDGDGPSGFQRGRRPGYGREYNRGHSYGRRSDFRDFSNSRYHNDRQDFSNRGRDFYNHRQDYRNDRRDFSNNESNGRRDFSYRGHGFHNRHFHDNREHRNDRNFSDRRQQFGQQNRAENNGGGRDSKEPLNRTPAPQAKPQRGRVLIARAGSTESVTQSEAMGSTN